MKAKRTNNKAKYNKSRVMKRAWAILRKEGAENITWSECLTQSWNIEKNGTSNITIEFLYSEYYQQIVNFIKARTNNNPASEEIAQDVFIKANEHLANYDVLKAKANTWLYQIAKNKVIDFWRANKNAANISHVDGWTDSEGKETFEFTGTYHVDNVESTETNEAIMCAIGALKEKEQAIAIMYFIDDKQYSEISELLDIPMGSVKGMLSRIRAKLQEKLQTEYTQL